MIKTALLLLVTLALCCGGPISRAGEGRLRFTLCSSGSLKYPFLGKGSRNYHLFGAAGFGIGMEVAGSMEEALSFLPKLSLVRENTGYHHVSSSKYFIETINLVFNPEIMIPTRSERWKIAAGIGIDWMADMTLTEYNTQTYTSGNLDAVYDTIVAARRPLIPFVSAGIRYRLHKGFHMQVFLRQDLRDAFPDDTIVTFGRGNNPLTVNLSHQPTRLGLDLMYIF